MRKNPAFLSLIVAAMLMLSGCHGFVEGFQKGFDDAISDSSRQTTTATGLATTSAAISTTISTTSTTNSTHASTANSTTRAATTSATKPAPASKATATTVAATEEANPQIVYWGHTGEKIHIDPDCRTLKNGALSGTLEEAKAAGRSDWCKVCSKGWSDEKFLQSDNPYAK